MSNQVEEHVSGEHYRAIADGAEVISDFQVMSDQAGLFGPVAPFLTAWRTLDEIAAGGTRLSWKRRSPRRARSHDPPEAAVTAPGTGRLPLRAGRPSHREGACPDRAMHNSTLAGLARNAQLAAIEPKYWKHIASIIGLG
jgi:hypothetical protein